MDKFELLSESGEFSEFEDRDDIVDYCNESFINDSIIQLSSTCDSLSFFIKTAGEFEPFGVGEEHNEKMIILRKESFLGDKEARENAVNHNYKLVLKLIYVKIKQITRLYRNTDVEELILAGCEGLQNAFDEWQPYLWSFSTYAVSIINNHLNFADLSHRCQFSFNNESERKRAFRSISVVNKQRNKFNEKFLYWPNDAELIDFAKSNDDKLSKADIQLANELNIKLNKNFIYAEDPVNSDSSGDSFTILDIVGSYDTYNIDAEDKNKLIKELRDYIFSLPYREKEVAKYTFGIFEHDDFNDDIITDDDLAKKLGFKRQTIYDIRRLVKKKIKEKFSNNDLLKAYLL